MIIVILIPILLFSTMKYTLAITTGSNIIIFCITRPLLTKSDFPKQLAIGMIACVASVISIVVYEKFLVNNIWGKVKNTLA